METSATNASIKSHRARRWIVAIVIALIVVGYIGFMLWGESPAPFAVLPDGTKIVYHSGSRGSPSAPSKEGFKMFRHEPPKTSGRWRDLWTKFRDEVPSGVRRWLPVWEAPVPSYPGWTGIHELELRLLYYGSFQPEQWEIYVADDQGWKTRTIDCGIYRGAPLPSSSTPSWLEVAGPYPRHCKTIRLCFYFKPQPETEVAELPLDNPFYEGPAPPAAPKPPLTQAFRHGEITLEKLTRGARVAPGHENLCATFFLQENHQPLVGYDFSNIEVTDSSGQWFRQTGSRGSSSAGRYEENLPAAPWSDDRCWTIRFDLSRSNYNPTVEDEEKFVFDHLPAPAGQDVEVNRTITKNGVTLRIARMELSKQHGGWRFCVEGGWGPTTTKSRWLIIQDAHDDQGRTRALYPGGGNLPIVTGPLAGNDLGPVLGVNLPADAQWWNLVLAPASKETLEFKVQPELVPEGWNN